MNKKVVIIGAGGHGKVIADIIKRNNDEVVGFLDDKEAALPSPFHIVGKLSDANKYKDYWFIVAIGNNETRKNIMQTYHSFNWYTAIHPSAVIAEDVELQPGTVVMANAVINSGSKIGRGVIINTSSSVDHDCMIDEFCHIAVGAHLAGSVNVGQGTFIGAGATLINNINICDNCTIGAGAVVIKDIKKAGTYIGVPARKA